MGRQPRPGGGAVTFNVLTTVFTGGAGAAAKGGAVARTVGALGRTARLVDPMTYLGKAAKFGTVKVSDLFANLRTVNAGAYADLAAGAGRVQPDGTVVRVTDDTPVIHDNVVEWPDGTRLNLDDGSVVRADGTAAPAKVELSAADRALLERSLPHEEGALVGAGERAGVHAAGDVTARGGGHTPPTAHVGEHAGTRGLDTVPARDTGGHSSGGDGHAGGDATDSGRIPSQHGGTGGGDGRSGPTTSPAGSHGDPAEGRELSAAERKRIQNEHVWRANNDPDWRDEHYDALDRRKDASKTVDGVELPILARDADGNLVAKHDLPSGPSDVKFGRTPLGPDTAPQRIAPNSTDWRETARSPEI